MLFKNLSLFRLEPAYAAGLDDALLEARLAEHPARDCGALEFETSGFAPPLGRDASQWVHAADGCLLVCLQTEQKLLPPGIIGQELDDRIANLEKAEERQVSRRERSRMKEQVVDQLLPQAFARRRRCYGYFDPANRHLAIDTATPKEADRFTAELRQTLGTLPIVPAGTANSPSATMTGWLASPQTLPSDLAFDGDCELEHEGRVRCQDQDMTGKEIRAHLDAGKRVRRLGLVWDERLAFQLDEHLVIRRLRFKEFIDDELERLDLEDEAAVFDAEFAIMAGELRRLLGRLVSVFGGEA
jgi:recombination associated protein RdgC